ncbi:MAG: helix-turn-helix domain-containing protein [Chitinophagales bacterium]
MHLGRNIAKLRSIKGYKQEEFAKLLKMSQQAVSRLENKKDIEEEMLQLVADKLQVPIEAIKAFSSESVINNFNQQGGSVSNNVENVTINPIEKIEALYKQIIKDKDKFIAEQKKEIEALKRTSRK